MRISYHKNPLGMNGVKRVLNNLKGKRNVKYFLVISDSKKPNFHCNIFSKFHGAKKWLFCSQKLKSFKQVRNNFLQTC